MENPSARSPGPLDTEIHTKVKSYQFGELGELCSLKSGGRIVDDALE